MHTRLKPAILGLVFLVGCAVGGVSSQLVVPVATAQQKATLTTWEYHCVRMADDLNENFNAFGKEGWELSTTALIRSGLGSYQVWCFKRPKL